MGSSAHFTFKTTERTLIKTGIEKSTQQVVQ